ncbi:MAG: hypothetical protein ACKOWK_02460 [Micrococcales bacterium]
MLQDDQAAEENTAVRSPLEAQVRKTKGSEKISLILAICAFIAGAGALVAVVLGAIIGAVYGGLHGFGNGAGVQWALLGIFIGTGLVLATFQAIALPQIAGALEVFNLVVLGFVVWQAAKENSPRRLSKTMVSSFVLASLGVVVGALFLASSGLLKP